MALDKSALVSSLKSAFLQNLQQTDADSEARQKAEQSAEVMANNMASAIETFIKSGTVAFTTGSVQGTCPSGGGPLTAGAATGGTIS